MRGVAEYGLYKVEVRKNDVLGIGGEARDEFEVNLAENVEATSRNIAIPVTQLDLLQRARERERERVEIEQGW